eukprot:TRINITY_DN67420_c8_g8_i3.p1 TRINITY_DN67420_c8_g8~~TRINITY_DN67420_c8_g8_i3.p1  ORF type:complete len:343 (-),score=28.20 TRINITY_DN67420_c8_g8_i3:468-1469(-)
MTHLLLVLACLVSVTGAFNFEQKIKTLKDEITHEVHDLVEGPDDLSANTRVVATGFSWCENFRIDTVGNQMFAADFWRAHLIALKPTPSGLYNKTIHASDPSWKKILGIALNETARIVYFVAQFHNGTNAILETSADVAHGGWATVATTPKQGNGLGIHLATGLLYTTCEGNELPNGGVVYEINPRLGTVRTVTHKLWSADGLWIDQDRAILYVGEMLDSKIWAFNLTSQEPIYQSSRHHVSIIDDLTVSAHGQDIIVANWAHNRVVAFHANEPKSSAYAVGAGGFHHPTSVRFGIAGTGFPATSLYVSEGCGLGKKVTTCRILEVQNFNIRW